MFCFPSSLNLAAAFPASAHAAQSGPDVKITASAKAKAGRGGDFQTLPAPRSWFLAAQSPAELVAVISGSGSGSHPGMQSDPGSAPSPMPGPAALARETRPSSRREKGASPFPLGPFSFPLNHLKVQPVSQTAPAYRSGPENLPTESQGCYFNCTPKYKSAIYSYFTNLKLFSLAERERVARDGRF